MDVRWLLPLIALGSALSAEEPTRCVTPNNENATCIHYEDCKVIFQELAIGAKDSWDFASESVCGSADDEDRDKLCCGSAAYSSVYFTDDGEVLLRNFNLGVNSLPERSVCGVDEQIYKLAGANFWKRSEFPWTALLEYKSNESSDKTEVKCEGVLISEQYVLTAAHCLSDDLVSIRFGEWNLTTDPDCLKSILKEDKGKQVCAPSVRREEVAKKIPHTFHNGQVNDVGLVKLKNKISYNGFVRPICLPPATLHWSRKGTAMTIVGWPRLKNGTVAEIKQRTEMPLLGDCTDDVGEADSYITQRQCLEGRKEPCGGRSGGGVMIQYKDKVYKEAHWYLEGVLVHNPDCTRNESVVYLRFAGYINWLTYTISLEELEEFQTRKNLKKTSTSKDENSTQPTPSTTPSSKK